MNEQTLKDIDKAFKALEERNELLDKIRAEIQMMADDEWNKQVGASKGLEEALEIIDKYRAESEDK